MQKGTGGFALVVSIFLVYHLSVVLILPNPQSVFGRELGRYLIPYANTLGFNSTWQFFSPGPSPTFYLEYDVEREDDVSEGPFSYPPRRQGMGWSDAFNRRVYTMRFFTMTGENLGRYFIPYLCRQHQQARRISVRFVTEVYPAIEKFERGEQFADSYVRNESISPRTFSCDEVKQ